MVSQIKVSLQKIEVKISDVATDQPVDGQTDPQTELTQTEGNVNLQSDPYESLNDTSEDELRDSADSPTLRHGVPQQRTANSSRWRY